MRNKLGIGFFGVMIVALMLVTGAYQLSYQRAKENMEVKLKVAKETQTEGSRGEETKAATPDPATVAADGQALKEDCYYLMEVNGYVVVYLSDKKTPYEYTDIKCDGLPSEMQNEIRNGKYMEDAKALYGFLENYSS